MLPDPVGAEALLAAEAPVETLVPADVGGLRAAAGVLRSSAATLETAGSSLSRVEVTEWRGDASTAFEDRIAVEPGRWRAASDSFSAGASALERYADDVVTARSTAAAAVEVYRRYRAAVSALDPAAVGSLSPAMSVGMQVSRMQDSPDPVAARAADGLRRQALDLLDRARVTVVGAGDMAAAALSAACSEAPAARRFWESSIRAAGATGAGHSALDAVGLVPVVGDPADGVNALWYARDGDYENAGMSAVGLVPLVGEYVILQKFGRKVLFRDGVVQGGRAGADILGRDTLRQLGDGGLLAHELGEDFHTIARHVGRTDMQLAERLTAEPNLKRASTFANVEDAELYTYANLGVHQAEIESYLTFGSGALRLRLTFDHAIGRTAVRELADPLGSSTVVTVLRQDPSMANGYRIVTSFPEIG